MEAWDAETWGPLEGDAVTLSFGARLAGAVLDLNGDNSLDLPWYQQLSSAISHYGGHSWATSVLLPTPEIYHRKIYLYCGALLESVELDHCQAMIASEGTLVSSPFLCHRVGGTVPIPFLKKSEIN